MAVFKCKMCGGPLELTGNQAIVECLYCGVKQTLPKLSDEKIANMYDRANHFRRNNEFDKAMSIYEQILTEDKTDAEAYWSLVLCRYGIEYVEDPETHKRVPTVNRAQFTSIFDDDNYKMAIEYADLSQKSIYEDEARAINEIQKGILAISQKEEPFDVFICYKETDNNGRRTQDSVLANDLYHQLTAEGFKVFFSRITLEDKLGVAYEPYIFAALNSSKVMVVIGTKPEYFNAVWVKNEWGRYLSLVKQSDGKKIIIPAYRDMDPYDLPEEFSHLQAQDMSKLGFMQDLIRGIKKICSDSGHISIKDTVAVSGALDPLLKRAFMFLEDGDFASANEYCEKVLDQDPENARAYLGKLMSELRVRKQDSLRDQDEPFDNHNNYQKALRFADKELKSTLIGYIDYINKRNEDARIESIYNQAEFIMFDANTESEYKEAAKLFESISTYKDAATLANECYKKAEIARAEAEKQAKRNKKIAITATTAFISIVCAVIAFVMLLNEVILPNLKYNYAVELMEAGKYSKAISAFTAMDGYKDSKKQIQNCETAILDGKYNDAIALMNAGKYTEAISAFTAMDGYKDSKTQIQNCNYNYAIDLMEAGKTVEAYEALIALNGYKDSAEKAKSIYAEYKVEKLKSPKVGDYVFFGAYEQDNNTSNGKEDIEWLVLDKKDGKVLVISKNALNCQQYNTSYTGVTWETCTLRKWLNGTFLGAAFSENEREMIPTVTVSADKNPEYSTNPGNATQDKVFLLSIAEANKYFSSDSARQCEATAYAEAQGEYVSSSNGNCRWWLRSPGFFQREAAYVDNVGVVHGSGCSVDYSKYAVRPALWIDLNS